MGKWDPLPNPIRTRAGKGGGGSWGGEASYRPLIWEEKTICLYLTNNNFLPKIWGKWDPNPIRTRTESKRGPGRGAERQRTWSQPACGTCTACRPRSTIPLHPACLTPSFNYHSLLRVNFGVPLCIVLGGWGGGLAALCPARPPPPSPQPEPLFNLFTPPPLQPPPCTYVEISLVFRVFFLLFFFFFLFSS